MEGIGVSKEFADFIIAIAMGTDKSLENGKWEYSDAFNYWEAAKTGAGLLPDLKNLPKEMADYSEDEKKVLNNYFATKLDLSNDIVEGFIEGAYNIALSLAKMAALKLGQK